MNFLKNSCLFVILFNIRVVAGLFEFPTTETDIPQNVRTIMNEITENDLRTFVTQGTQSAAKELRLEENLLNSGIIMRNGSLSHKQLLETLPNDMAKRDSEVAIRILRSSLYAYNTKCIENDISGINCRLLLSKKSIPKDTELWEDCNRVTQGQRKGHHVFRRLLPSNYQDGFYRMFSETKLPSPRMVSSETLLGQVENVDPCNEAFDENQHNVALVQWAQFIEHDISKPVTTSMRNGAPIECCHHDNYKLAPRFQHPSCAPLISKNHQHKHGRETCLNYVRSALAVDSTCNFGGAEQLNQVSGFLDLSQLYGSTEDEERLVRTHRLGEIKSTHFSPSLEEEFLPFDTNTGHLYCAFEQGSYNQNCFMAGDSRVNNNPFSIVLYTIFMRLHNRIANNLHLEHADWDDDHLYETSRSINIDIYRRIVFKEWLPCVLGQQLVNDIIAKMPQRDVGITKLLVSNEFATAATRFYFSMMPNFLQNTTKNSSYGPINNHIAVENSIVTPTEDSLPLGEHMHRSTIFKDAITFNNILDSILRQRAMKMDAQYAETFTSNPRAENKITRIDTLAFDIQRGRDHGLQGYTKYLEICQGKIIRDWNDLRNYIDDKDIQRLQMTYGNLSEVDLIVGGILENPSNGSIVGPTFTCILAEQFSKIHQWHQVINNQSTQDLSIAQSYQNWTGADLLCANSQLTSVPRNIFKISSESNPSIRCAAIA